MAGGTCQAFRDLLQPVKRAPSTAGLLGSWWGGLPRIVLQVAFDLYYLQQSKWCVDLLVGGVYKGGWYGEAGGGAERRKCAFLFLVFCTVVCGNDGGRRGRARDYWTGVVQLELSN
jgi:hypothetical protein